MAITSFNIQDGSYKERRCVPRIRKRHVIIFFAITIIVIAVVAYMLLIENKKSKQTEVLIPPNPTQHLQPSPSKLKSFNEAAVSSGSSLCSNIGVNILKKNGSVVDSIIATMFCNSLVMMQSMGLGGGFFMTIYSKKENKMYTLNARETAPLAAKEDMFNKDPSKAKNGGLAVGVPGELKGYIAAHNKFGRLPWKDLIQPTIDICKKGFNISNHQANALRNKQNKIKEDELLSKLFIDTNGTLRKSGDFIKHDIYCETLKNISNNKYDFYNGSLADYLVEDIKEMGGIITKEDLLKYDVIWEEPVSIKIKDDTFYSAPLPANGNILGLILNVLQGYNFTKESVNENNTILTYHRIIEAFKYAYAKRTYLGDPKFVNMTDIINEITSNEFAENITDMIKDNETSQDPTYYGAKSSTKDDFGTAHVSVLAENGDAASATSTVNLYFGAGVMSKQTGIILNSGMDDFSSDGFKNFFGLPYTPANKIAPGKRALSSMCPSIILDKNNNVKLVIGAAGGTKIPSSLALVIMNSLWFHDDIKTAIDEPRFHNQLFPMVVDYEYGLVQSIVDGLKSFGHKMERSKATGSVINAILVRNNTVYANADYRKGGDASGY